MKRHLHITTHNLSSSLSVIIPPENHGSTRAAPPAPPAPPAPLTRALLGIRPPSSLTKAQDTMSTGSIQKLMSLLMAYLASCQRPHSHTTFPSSPTGSQSKWLLVLPPQYHPHLNNYGNPIADRLQGSILGKKAITHRSQNICFLTWCHIIGLLNPCTPTLPLQGGNWALACHTVVIIKGHTITGV